MLAVGARWWGVGGGIAGEKARRGGALEGWPGRRRTGSVELFRGGGGRRFGRWWLAAQGGVG